MTQTTCKKAGTPKVCPKKTTKLFYVTHPKAAKAVLGPFLSEADAECGRLVMRSAEAKVTPRFVEFVDELVHGHATNNGHVMRSFAGADRKGAM